MASPPSARPAVLPKDSSSTLSMTPTVVPSLPLSPRGVFGFVKRVQHKGNKMFCAAKFIPLRSKTRAQVYQERDILAMLNHPLVTGLLDQFETRKTLILILELYPAPGPWENPRDMGSQARVGVTECGVPGPGCYSDNY